MTDIKFEMKCPKCGENKWKLEYDGDTRDEYDGLCTKTENVSTYIGVHGNVVIICLNCKYRQDISVGSD